MSALEAGLIVMLLVAGGLGWACYRLLVDRGRLLLRLEAVEADDPREIAAGLPAGSYLSDFALPALPPSGETLTLGGLAGQPLLLIFARTDCLFSRTLARELAGRPRKTGDPLPVVLLSGETGDPEDMAPFAALAGSVLLDAGARVARLARVAVTPAGYLVDEWRRTVGSLLMGPVALLAAAGGEPVTEQSGMPRAVTLLPAAEPPLAPLQPGEEAPPFTLPTLAGEDWSLRAQRGQRLTLLFSDESCPPCAALLAALEDRELPGLVLIGRGDAGESPGSVALSGKGVPVLRQRRREVARLFGTLETPAAYAVDERGIISAGPAIGADEVLALLRV